MATYLSLKKIKSVLEVVVLLDNVILYLSVLLLHNKAPPNSVS